WSQIDSLVFFYLLTAGIGLMQAATLYEPAFAVLARRVGAARSRQAITTLTLWGGFASTVFIPLIQWLLDQWGWRGALMVLGLVKVLLCTSLHLVFIRPERDSISTEPGAAGRQIAVDRQAVHTAVRRPVFWALLLALTVYAAMFSAFTFHMYPMFIEHGMATVTVVQTIALIGPAQVA